MMLSFLLAAAGTLNQDQFTQAMEVPQPIRLQLTPVIDGAGAKDEWDPFGPQTFLQWEPGKIHIAGFVGEGRDLVLSIDGKGDGWLVGRDNIEFRITHRDGKATVVCRELDATAVKQPIWRDRDDLEAASMAASGPGEGGVFVEATLDDAGIGVLPRTSKGMTLRLDAVEATPDSEPFLPRLCMPFKLDDSRAAALPPEMEFSVQARTRTVVPGEDLWMRLNFKGKNSLGVKSIELKGLGDAETTSNRMAVVFPNFDNKGRAFVDYASKIDLAASQGYRILRGTMTFDNGPAGMVEASYRVAPTMSFRFERSDFDRLPENNRLRLRYLLQMHTKQPVDGIVRIEAPEGWQVITGNGTKFAMLGNQSFDSRNVELAAPADAHGTFPIRFTGETKNGSVAQTCFITIR